MNQGAQARSNPAPPPPSKRDAVLQAALELFAERTFGATPVPDIASRARVGAGTVYRYFASKEELGNAVFRDSKRALHAALATALEGSGDVHEQFRRLWRGLTRFAAERPQTLRFLEMQHHADYLDDESRSVSADLFETAERFVRGGQQQLAIRAGDPGLLLALVFGAFVGMIKESDQGHFALSDAIVEQAGEAAWRMLAI